MLLSLWSLLIAHGAYALVDPLQVNKTSEKLVAIAHKSMVSEAYSLPEALKKEITPQIPTIESVFTQETKAILQRRGEQYLTFSNRTTDQNQRMVELTLQDVANRYLEIIASPNSLVQPLRLEKRYALYKIDTNRDVSTWQQKLNDLEAEQKQNVKDLIQHFIKTDPIFQSAYEEYHAASKRLSDFAGREKIIRLALTTKKVPDRQVAIYNSLYFASKDYNELLLQFVRAEAAYESTWENTVRNEYMRFLNFLDRHPDLQAQFFEENVERHVNLNDRL